MLGISQGEVVVRRRNGEEVHRLPFATIDSISVYGCAQLTTQLIRECLTHGIPIAYYTDDGHFFGKTSSFERIDPLRQKWQIILTNSEEFCLDWTKRIVGAKMANSLTLVMSMPHIYEFQSGDIKGISHSIESLNKAGSIEEVLGYEGNAAKNYFQCLPKLLINEEFYFRGRSARPPRDPFNSMLSYGYSLLYRNIIGAIERHGLHPYFSFMHKIKAGHAALASDLIEEYRAVLIDKTVIGLINSGEIDIADFYDNGKDAIYMTRGVMKKLTDAFSECIAERKQYYSMYDDHKSYGFQAMLDKKLNMLAAAIEKQDPSLYKPFIWRPENVQNLFGL